MMAIAWDEHGLIRIARRDDNISMGGLSNVWKETKGGIVCVIHDY
jgi:hypothetical protein